MLLLKPSSCIISTFNHAQPHKFLEISTILPMIIERNEQITPKELFKAHPLPFSTVIYIHSVLCQLIFKSNFVML